MQRCASPSSARTTIISIRTCARENGIEYGDLPKFVDYDYTANVARLNAATLASLASAPAPPANVRLLTKELQNDSTLEWEPLRAAWPPAMRCCGATPRRPTGSRCKSVGNVTRVTLPVSKDNVIFAVRAVDAKGHRSLAVVPCRNVDSRMQEVRSAL